jgi:hypothetical protein
MAEKCGDQILAWETANPGLPKPLQPRHLAWMCHSVAKHAEDWSPAKLNRWIGFVQCAMMAHRMIDLTGAKALFDEAKVAYGEISEDFLDHLDPQNSFEMDIGGEG